MLPGFGKDEWFWIWNDVGPWRVPSRFFFPLKWRPCYKLLIAKNWIKTVPRRKLKATFGQAPVTATCSSAQANNMGHVLAQRRDSSVTDHLEEHYPRGHKHITPSPTPWNVLVSVLLTVANLGLWPWWLTADSWVCSLSISLHVNTRARLVGQPNKFHESCGLTAKGMLSISHHLVKSSWMCVTNCTSRSATPSLGCFTSLAYRNHFIFSQRDRQLR